MQKSLLVKLELTSPTVLKQVYIDYVTCVVS